MIPNVPLPPAMGGTYSDVASGEGVVPSMVQRARYLTVAEVADIMRVSTMTVYRLIKAGELPSTRVGKSYRLAEDDVDRYLARSFTEAG